MGKQSRMRARRRRGHKDGTEVEGMKGDYYRNEENLRSKRYEGMLEEAQRRKG